MLPEPVRRRLVRPRLGSIGALAVLAAVLLLAATGSVGVTGATPPGAPEQTVSTQVGDGWRSSFPVDRANLTSSGKNPYFVLEPGYRLHLAHGKETLVVSVLEETKMVDGVETRVVEEREERNGKLTELSRNYFAIDRSTGDVYYFGEDSAEYRNGKPAGSEGSWLAGVGGARFGLMMPGTVRVGDRFHQEVAPEAAMDRAEIVAVDGEVEVPAGTFTGCVHVKETSPLEKGSDWKWYAPGVGLVKDDGYVLVKVEAATARVAASGPGA